MPNTTSFRTPGVAIREVDNIQSGQIRLDIAGFVGQAERGPLHSPQAIFSWGEYQDFFGGFIGYGYLPYCVFAFFANGGQKCYITRVAHETATSSFAAIALTEKNTNPTIAIAAINPGSWGDSIEVVAFKESTSRLMCATLEKDAAPGQDFVIAATITTLSDFDIGDAVTLIDKRDPSHQENFQIKNIDFDDNKMIFDRLINKGFAVGSHIIAKGFKLVFYLWRNRQKVKTEVFDNLSMCPKNARYFERIINGDPEELDYLKKMQAGHSTLVRLTDLRQKNNARARAISERLKSEGFSFRSPGKCFLQHGSDGNYKALSAAYFTGYNAGDYFRPPAPADITPDERKWHYEKWFGLAALEAVEEIGAVLIPDLIIPDFYGGISNSVIPNQGVIFADFPVALASYNNLKIGQADMLYHCKRMTDRFAIFDSPRAARIGLGENQIQEWTDNFSLLNESKYGAIYYPWLQQKAADFEGYQLYIPPCGHIMGVYSRTERTNGVGKAPANEILEGVVELEFCLTDEDQAALNEKGVNCIRSFAGRGIKIWGARTLSQQIQALYINIRRITLAIIKNILVDLRWTVFEPNEPKLWDKITTVLQFYFIHLYQSGVLAGATWEDAFFVKCDGENNPQEIADMGQVIIEIGFAPARPAEFILVTIIRSPGALSVMEK